MKDKKLIIGIVMMTGICLFFISGVGTKQDSFDGILFRDEPGGQTLDYTFDATVGNISINDIEMSVEPREYSYSEKEALFIGNKEKIVKAMLNENRDSYSVSTDLDFSNSLSGLPFNLSYFVADEGIFDVEGRLITAEAFKTVIEIHGIYEESDFSFAIKVEGTPTDDIKRRVYKESLLAMSGNSSKDMKAIELPTVIDGKKVTYSNASKKRNAVYLLLGVIGSIAVFLGQRKDKVNAKKKRVAGILKDYPVLLQKMSLYLAAGMNIRNIWLSIYEEEKRKENRNEPLIEEMSILVNELQNSIPESIVYKRFGERTGLPEMIRFTALLSQNLKKGSSRLRELLDEEARKAYLEKKQRAIRLGEEAGTKLLIPMMLLLIDVMVIIVVPALLSI